MSVIKSKRLMVERKKFVQTTKPVSKKGTIKKIEFPKIKKKAALKASQNKTVQLSKPAQRVEQSGIMKEKLFMKGKISRNTTLSDVVHKYPEAAMVMMKYGMHCIGCHVAAFETVEQGCKGHGMSDEEIDRMIKEMNEIVK